MSTQYWEEEIEIMSREKLQGMQTQATQKYDDCNFSDSKKRLT